MPELPEVETTRRGIEPHIRGRRVQNVLVRQGKLRWQIPAELPLLLKDRLLLSVSRRAKYLLFCFDHGTLIAHLGMSGSMRIVTPSTWPERHDHLDLVFSGGKVLRYRDPRRFGAWLWQAAGTSLPMLEGLGPEPLSSDFSVDQFIGAIRRRNTPIKTLLMDQRLVVGIGNIYACEALFAAGIHPARQGSKVSEARLKILWEKLRETLREAIQAGGTTLKDFVTSDGTPGYFAQQLKVYGRADQPCVRCGHRIVRIHQAGRSTYYCPSCQT